MEYTIIRSRRKTVSIEVSHECRVIVRAPLKMPQREIECFVLKHEAWIENAITKQCEITANTTKLSAEEINTLYKRAQEILPVRVKYYSELMKLYPVQINITRARKRFGSCSSKKVISFSVLLMAYPLEAIDYVIVHELAHIKHMNHSKEFYELIEEYLPDHNERKKMLSQHSYTY